MINVEYELSSYRLFSAFIMLSLLFWKYYLADLFFYFQKSEASNGTRRFKTDFQIFQNKTNSKPESTLDKPDAAVKIQRAFRKYKESKHSLETVGDVGLKTQDNIAQKKTNRRVLNLFTSAKNKLLKNQSWV